MRPFIRNCVNDPDISFIPDRNNLLHILSSLVGLIDPLQIFLRQILVQNKFDTSEVTDPELAQQLQGLNEVLKYSIIVVSSAPLMCLYPFVQKHFVKGVMIGSVKG